MFLTLSGSWGHHYRTGTVSLSRALSGRFCSFTASGRWAIGTETGEDFTRAQGAATTTPAGRSMLRGKSRLNVEWLGYSPGLLLQNKPLLAGRTPRNLRGRDGCIFSGWITTTRLMGFTAWTGV
uniref:vacuolar ATPase assembly integral membrane protein VMA21 isoform X2 n=1 Tax=Urocitellus parryii TaxID=9999 RepID=UPI000E55C6C0|nr:vacuolar ATPase assembly integral membrane protein VMA21 isoform X2 [Urocitellus parryii]